MAPAYPHATRVVVYQNWMMKWAHVITRLMVLRDSIHYYVRWLVIWLVGRSVTFYFFFLLFQHLQVVFALLFLPKRMVSIFGQWPQRGQ